MRSRRSFPRQKTAGSLAGHGFRSAVGSAGLNSGAFPFRLPSRTPAKNGGARLDRLGLCIGPTAPHAPPLGRLLWLACHREPPDGSGVSLPSRWGGTDTPTTFVGAVYQSTSPQTAPTRDMLLLILVKELFCFPLRLFCFFTLRPTAAYLSWNRHR